MKTKLIAALLGAALAACSSGAPQQAVVHGSTSVFGGSTRELLSMGALKSINGTYGASCTARSGAWSLLVDPEATPDNPILSVVENDSGCVLTLTEMHTATGLFEASPSIAMSGDWQSSSSAFAPSEGALSFYGNAMITPSGFGSDFVVDVLYSADPGQGGDAGVTAGYNVVQGSVSQESVPSPDYTIDVTGLSLQTDASNIVQSASGSASLIPGSIAGQVYVIAASALPASPTFADVDGAFQASMPDGGAYAIGDGIPAAEFALEGTDLSSPAQRTVIVANTASGVTSYETFTVTFAHP